MKEKQQITLVNTNDNGGGAAVACLRLYKALSQHTDFNVKLLVQDKNTKLSFVEGLNNTWFAQKMAFVRFVLERLYFWFFEKNKQVRFMFSPAKVGVDISQHSLIQKADVVHLHWINFGFLSLKNLQQLFDLNKPIVWTMHDMWVFTGGCHHAGTCQHFEQSCGQCKFLKNPIETDLSHQIWKQKMALFQTKQLTIVACSEWLARQARQSSLLKNHRVLSIPNPIDVSVFRPIDKNEAKLALNLPKHTPLILFAAMRVDAPGKGFSFFVEALNILSKTTNLKAALLIFGSASTNDFDNLPFKAHQLGRLTDFTQIALAYSAASVFVIPSLEENLPNTIMESMACGTPVVGFEIGGIPEMIDHQNNGYLANYRSAEDLAKGMAWILENPNYAQLCQNARIKVLTNYAEDVVAKRYAALY